MRLKKVKKNFIKYRRYCLFFVQHLIERIRGLDFTMRDMSAIKESKGVLHGYSKTYEKHFEEIMKKINITENDSFLDIGCGKGSVLRQAAKYPFKAVAGIDFDGNLINIANQNFRILKLSDRINCTKADARTFLHYCDYNVFYLFNPFGDDIMKSVIERIVRDTEKMSGGGG